MADIQSNIKVNIDTSNALEQLKLLQGQISAFHTQMAKSGAQASAQAAQLRQNLINGINATGQFSAQMTTVRTSTEYFTQALEKNKLTMGEYFRYAGGASKTFGKLFKSEFETITKVARERVKDLQTQYIKMGRDANGAMQAIKVRPLMLDMDNLATKTAIAAQKQQLLNQLLKQGSTNLLNFGKNTQWAGRQLMVGFTVPLTMFGSVAIKAFNEMEKAVVKFKRVYGDLNTLNADTDRMVAQITKLAESYTKFGVAVKDTMEMAATAAATGKQGADLIAQVENATKLAVLGGVDQQKALETTISLTNAFGISAEDLAKKINFLNAVENQTILSIEDLTTAIPKAGPVIEQLGGSVEDLAFFMTAMKEGGINASEGANALKSGLASMINPTGKAAEMLGKLGINLNGIVEANKGDIKKTVVDFGNALNKLDPLNRAKAIEQLFGKFQFARLSTLFKNVTDQASQAATTLNLTKATAEELAIVSQRELNRIAESPTFKFDKAMKDFQKAIMPIGEQFLKAATPILNFFSDILKRFDNLDEGTKGFVTGLTAIVAGIGPVVLMVVGLVANGIANIIKLFANFKAFFNNIGKGSKDLTESTRYMTSAQIEAAAVAASLDQVHGKLKQTFTSEASAIANLTAQYQKAIAAQAAFRGTSIPAGPMPRKFASGGIISGPGTGTSDSILARVSNGEAIIPAASVARYPGLVKQLVSGNVPGFAEGTDFAHITSKKSIPLGTFYDNLMEAEKQGLVKLSQARKRMLNDYIQMFGRDAKMLAFSGLGFTQSKQLNLGMRGGAPVSANAFLEDFKKQGLNKWNQTLGMVGLKQQDVIEELTRYDNALQQGVQKMINVNKSATITDADFEKLHNEVIKTLPAQSRLRQGLEAASSGLYELRMNVSKEMLAAAGIQSSKVPSGADPTRMSTKERFFGPSGQQYRTGGNRWYRYLLGGLSGRGNVALNIDAIQKQGMLEAQAYLKGAASVLQNPANDPYVQSRNRNSPHALAAKDGTQDGQAYGQSRIVEAQKTRRQLIAEEKATATAMRKEQRAAKAALFKEKFGGTQGMQKVSMGLMMGSMAGSMAGGPLGEMSSQLMMPLMMMSMITGKVTAIIAALGLLAYAVFKVKEAYDQQIKKQVELTQSMGTSNKAMENFASYAKKATPSQIMDMRRANQGSLFNTVIGKSTYGQSFLQSDEGKKMLSSVAQSLASENQTATSSQLAAQLSAAVVNGIFTEAQALSIADNIGRQLKNYNLSMDVSAKLIEIFGPDGKNLSADPLTIDARLNIVGQQQKDLAASSQLIIPKIENEVGGLTSSEKYGDPIQKAIIPLIRRAGFFLDSNIVNDVTAYTTGMQNTLQNIQQNMDGLTLAYENAYNNAKNNNLGQDKLNQLTKVYQNGYEKLNTSQSEAYQGLIDTYNSAGDYQSTMQKALDEGITGAYKDTEQAGQAESVKTLIGGLKNTSNITKLIISAAVANKTMDLGSTKMYLEKFANDSEMIARLGVVTKKFGGVAASQMSMLANEMGAAQAQTFTKQVGTAQNQKQANLLLSGMLEARKASGVGGPNALTNIENFYVKNNKELVDMQNNLSKLKQYKNITLTVVGKVYGAEQVAAMKEDSKYFDSLNQQNRLVYTQTFDTYFNMKNDPAFERDYVSWANGDGKNEKDKSKIGYIKWLARQATEAAKLFAEASGEDTGGSSGEKAASFLDPLVKGVRDLYKSTQPLTTGFKDSYKALQDFEKNGKTALNGIAAQFHKLGAGPDLMSAVLGAAPEDLANYFDKNGNIIKEKAMNVIKWFKARAEQASKDAILLKWMGMSADDKLSVFSSMYSAGLEVIASKEKKINEKYDHRVKSLEQVSKLNKDIAQSQQDQMDVAEALSRGDVAAAAKAANQMVANDAERAIQQTKDALEAQRKLEIDNLTVTVNGKTLRKTEIEERIQKITNEIANNRFKALQNEVSIGMQLEENYKSLSKIYKLTGGDYSVPPGKKAASGGYISGPGSGTSDSIPAMLSNGEYVIRANAVKTIGVDVLNKLNQADRMKFANGGMVGYAPGGYVGPRPAPQWDDKGRWVVSRGESYWSTAEATLPLGMDIGSWWNKILESNIDPATGKERRLYRNSRIWIPGKLEPYPPQTGMPRIFKKKNESFFAPDFKIFESHAGQGGGGIGGGLFGFGPKLYADGGEVRRYGDERRDSSMFKSSKAKKLNLTLDDIAAGLSNPLISGGGYGSDVGTGFALAESYQRIFSGKGDFWDWFGGLTAPFALSGLAGGPSRVGSLVRTGMGVRGAKNALSAAGSRLDSSFNPKTYEMVRGVAGLAEKVGKLTPRLAFNISDEALEQMIKDGRYQNLRAGVRSSTTDTLEKRIAVEQATMGISPNAKPGKTPAYGFLTTKEDVLPYYNSIMGGMGPTPFGQSPIDNFNQLINPTSRYLSGYGNNTIVLKSKALGKATISFGDTLSIFDKANRLGQKAPKVTKLNSIVSAFPFLRNKVNKIQDMMKQQVPNYKEPAQFPYIEAHLPGGFTLDDIESIMVSPSSAIPDRLEESIAFDIAERVTALKQQLKQAGISGIKVKPDSRYADVKKLQRDFFVENPGASQRTMLESLRYPLPQKLVKPNILDKLKPGAYNIFRKARGIKRDIETVMLEKLYALQLGNKLKGVELEKFATSAQRRGFDIKANTDLNNFYRAVGNMKLGKNFSASVDEIEWGMPNVDLEDYEGEELFLQIAGAIYKKQPGGLSVKAGQYSGYIDVQERILGDVYLELQKRFRGKGVAQKFTTQFQRLLAKAGIDQVQIKAAMTDGGYAWAKAGFDFTDYPYDLVTRMQTIEPYVRDPKFHKILGELKASRGKQPLTSPKDFLSLKQKVQSLFDEEDLRKIFVAYGGYGRNMDITKELYRKNVTLGEMLLRGSTWEGFKDLNTKTNSKEKFLEMLTLLGAGRYANGGLVRKYVNGGMVSNKYAMGGLAMGTDTVPAMLTPGEFVIKKSAVDRIGAANLNKINGYADGGLVGGTANGTSIGDSVYNYNISISVKSESNPDQIADTVIRQIKRMDAQKLRSVNI